jgi:hypothetical protein
MARIVFVNDYKQGLLIWRIPSTITYEARAAANQDNGWRSIYLGTIFPVYRYADGSPATKRQGWEVSGQTYEGAAPFKSLEVAAKFLWLRYQSDLAFGANLLALPAQCESEHCVDCGASIETIGEYGFPKPRDEGTHYFIGKGGMCQRCWHVFLGQSQLADWLRLPQGVVLDCMGCYQVATGELWDGRPFCTGCMNVLIFGDPTPPADFTTEWAEPFTVFYAVAGSPDIIVGVFADQDEAVERAQDVLGWNEGLGRTWVQNLNEGQYDGDGNFTSETVWDSQPLAPGLTYRDGDSFEVHYTVTMDLMETAESVAYRTQHGLSAAQVLMNEEWPDHGPTPQQELDWAIHNDHAADAEVDYDFYHAQYDDDPSPYAGTYSEE